MYYTQNQIQQAQILAGYGYSQTIIDSILTRNDAVDSLDLTDTSQRGYAYQTYAQENMSDPNFIGIIGDGSSDPNFQYWLTTQTVAQYKAALAIRGAPFSDKPIITSVFDDIKSFVKDGLTAVKNALPGTLVVVTAGAASGAFIAADVVGEGAFDSASFEGIGETGEIINPSLINTSNASFDGAGFENLGENNMFDDANFFDSTVDNSPLPVDDIQIASDPITPNTSSFDSDGFNDISNAPPDSNFGFDKPAAVDNFGSNMNPSLLDKVLSGTVNKVFGTLAGTRAVAGTSSNRNNLPQATNGSLMGRLFNTQTPTISASNPGAIQNTLPKQSMIILFSIIAGFFLLTLVARK